MIPNLLRHKGSAVILDPKGENFLVTAQKRSNLGNRVFYYDPWNIIEDYSKQHRSNLARNAAKAVINPLDLIEQADKDMLDKANMLASSMVVRPEDNKDPLFFDQATLFITRLIIYVCTAYAKGNKARTLETVRKLITSDKKSVLQEIDGFCKSNPQTNRIIVELRNWIDDNFFQRKTAASQNFIQIAENATNFLLSEHVRDSLSGASNIDMLSLKINPTSLYLIFDTVKLVNQADYYKPLIRLIIAACMIGASVNRQPKESLLFMLDEIAQLGTLHYLPGLLAIYAGKGVVVWTIWQNLAQIKKNYPDDWSTIIGNCSVQQYFGVNEQETAEYVSKEAGNTTIYEETYTESDQAGGSQSDTTGWGNQYSSGTSSTTGSSTGYSYSGFNYTNSGGKSNSQTTSSNYTDSYNFSRTIQKSFSKTKGRNLAKKAVPLITPYEVSTGNAYGVQFVFFKGKCIYPILSGKIKYYDDKEFLGEFGDNLTR